MRSGSERAGVGLVEGGEQRAQGSRGRSHRPRTPTARAHEASVRMSWVLAGPGFRGVARRGTVGAAADLYQKTELYGLVADPHELENLVGLTSRRAVADGLRDELAVWLLRSEGAAPVIEAAPARTLDQRRPESFPDDRVPWEGVRFGHRHH
ncbi:hypothetical protein [Streptomyces zaomyceticus]|uniref:hypothetical protein n=1 Tax=Streptomyces zaomyceticus TaxID=68286 RepID=UPI0034233261